MWALSYRQYKSEKYYDKDSVNFVNFKNDKLTWPEFDSSTYNVSFLLRFALWAQYGTIHGSFAPMIRLTGIFSSIFSIISSKVLLYFGANAMEVKASGPPITLAEDTISSTRLSFKAASLPWYTPPSKLRTVVGFRNVLNQNYKVSLEQ